MGAVGPSQILVFVNGRMQGCSTSRGTPTRPGRHRLRLLGPGPQRLQPTDPGVEYDRLSQRWIVSGINTERRDNRVMLAVSDGPTITEQSELHYFFFDAGGPAAGAPRASPTIRSSAVDNNAIYVGVNEFTSRPATASPGRAST